MTAKIEEAILGLANFDYKKMLIENQAQNSFSVRNSSQKKSSSQTSFCQLESSVLSQLDFLKAQRADIMLQKKQAKIDSLKKTDKINEEIRVHQKALNLIKRNLKTLKIRAENVEKIAKDKQNEKLEAFRAGLKPIEDAANAIIAEKKALKTRKNELVEKISENKDLRNSKNSEFSSFEALKSQKIEEKKRFEQRLKELEKEDECSFQEFFQETETKKIMQKLREKKSGLIGKVREVNKELEETEEEIKANSELREIEKKRENLERMTSDKEVRDIEEYFYSLSRDVSVLSLLDFVNGEITKSGNPVEDLVSKAQYFILDIKGIELNDQWNRNKEQFESELRELNNKIDEQELEIAVLENLADSSHQDLEFEIRGNKLKLETLKKETEKQHRKNFAVQKVIENWKLSNRKVLLLNENERSLNDSYVLNLYKLYLRKQVANNDHWNALEKLLDKYLQKITERNTKIIETQNRASQTLQLEILQDRDLRQLASSRSSLISEKESLQKEIAKTVILEKMTLQKFENFKIELEITRNKNLEKNIRQNLLENKASMLQIKKTYGQKALNKHTEREKEDLKTTQEKQQASNKKKIEEALSKIAEINNEILKIDSLINENCSKIVGKAEKNLAEFQSEIFRIEERVRILEETENELNEKVNSLSELKKVEIYRSLHRTLQAHGNEGDLKKIKKFEDLKSQKEGVIKRLNEDKVAVEEEYQEKLKMIEIEEIKVKIKLSAFKDD